MEDDNGAYRGRNRSFPHSKTMAFIHCLDKIDFYLIELNASAEFLISPWKLQFPNHSEGKKKRKKKEKGTAQTHKKRRKWKYFICSNYWNVMSHTRSKHNSKLESKLLTNKQPCSKCSKRKRRTLEHGRENLGCRWRKANVRQKEI